MSTTGMTTPSTAPSQLPVGTVYEGNLPCSLPLTQSSSSSATTTRPAGQTGEGGGKKKEERKLAIMMMSKKRKRLFDQIVKSRNKKSRKVGELKRKRQDYEDNRLEERDIKRTKVT